MARLALDPATKKFYEDELRGAAVDGSATLLKGGSPAAKKRSRAQGSLQDAARKGLRTHVNHSAAGGSIEDVGSDGLEASDDGEASLDSDGDGRSVISSSSQEDEPGLRLESGGESGSGSDGSSSDGASDLEGLPLASAVQIATGRRATGKRKARPEPAEAITEAGTTASKLGLVFERVLAKGSRHGILEGSKSLQRQRREEEASVAASKQARLARQEMRRRGHVEVLRRGANPERDAREKSFVRVATKGVVQLFNAITQAQKAHKDAEEAGVKEKDAVKQTKAALLQVLKPDSKAGQPEPAWKVLKSGFTGTAANNKLKDWEREAEEVDDIHDQVQDQDMDGASDEDFEDW